MHENHDAAPCMPIVKIVGYNPLSCNTLERMHEISSEFAKHDIIMLAGTQKMGNSQEITLQQTKCHTCYHWGYSTAKFTNKSAGCTIMLKKTRFKPQHNHKLYNMPKCLQGRGGAIRMKTGRHDLIVIVIYYPPRPRIKSEWPQYTKTCKLINEWLDELLSSTPARSTPFIYFDLNDHFSNESGNQRNVGNKCSGVQYETGRIVQELLVKHDIMALNTFTDGSHTYHGENHSSQIDFVCMPTELFKNLEKCVVCHKEAISLQAINTKKFRDHKPVELWLRYLLHFVHHPFQNSFEN